MTVVSLKSGLVHSAQAVDKPKAPLPTIRMDEGTFEEDGDAIAKDTQRKHDGTEK